MPSAHPFGTKNPCVETKNVRNLYGGIKLREKSAATLLKKMRQNKDTKKIESLLRVKNYSSGQKFSTSSNFFE